MFMAKIIERIVNADRVEDLVAVFGSFDENIKRIEESLGVSIVNRGTDLKVSGEEESVDKAARFQDVKVIVTFTDTQGNAQTVTYVLQNLA